MMDVESPVQSGFAALNLAPQRRDRLDTPSHVADRPRASSAPTDQSRKRSTLFIGNRNILNEEDVKETPTPRFNAGTPHLDHEDEMPATPLKDNVMVPEQSRPVTPTSPETKNEGNDETPAIPLKDNAVVPETPCPATPTSPATENEVKDTVMTDTPASSASAQYPHAEFTCVESGCATGQTQLHESRKAVSDHFGRNKKSTLMIQRWTRLCRKHYQRMAYHWVEWQKRKVDLIGQQLDMIQEDFPGVLFDIQLASRDHKRVMEYFQVFALKSKEKADVLLNAKPATKESSLQVLVTLEKEHCGKNKKKENCLDVLALVKGYLNDNTCEIFPDIEFLPQIANPSPKKTHKNKSPTKTPTKGRLNKKGAVQKTS